MEWALLASNKSRASQFLHFRKLFLKRANGKIDGLKPAMKESQAYTKQFGKAVFKASFEVN